MTKDWEKKMNFRMKSWSLVLSTFIIWEAIVGVASQHDYADALSKSILFFEGQRSGKLPSNQRMNWRKDSALDDGHQIGVSVPFLPTFHFSFFTTAVFIFFSLLVCKNKPVAGRPSVSDVAVSYPMQ